MLAFVGDWGSARHSERTEKQWDEARFPQLAHTNPSNQHRESGVRVAELLSSWSHHLHRLYGEEGLATLMSWGTGGEGTTEGVAGSNGEVGGAAEGGHFGSQQAGGEAGGR